MALARSPTPPGRRRSVVRHPVAGMAIAALIAAAVAVLIAELAGFHAVGRAFGRFTPVWLIAAAAAQAISVPAYVTAYRAVARRVTGRRPPTVRVMQLVLAGFGAFTVGGGFAYDERTMRRVGLSRSTALRTVLVLGGVEFLSLVWIAFLAAVLALIRDPAIPGGFVWPWLIAVPIGTATAVGLCRRTRAEDLDDRRVVLRALLAGLDDVLGYARRPRRFAAGWAGIVLYWVADGATLYLALRTFGLHASTEAVALAYGTGYLLSRRTLPLGGAGFVEFLMTLSLYWVHEPLAPALAGVLVYRGLDLLFAVAPAILARLRLEAALTAREAERAGDGDETSSS